MTENPIAFFMMTFTSLPLVLYKVVHLFIAQIIFIVNN